MISTDVCKFFQKRIWKALSYTQKFVSKVKLSYAGYMTPNFAKILKLSMCCTVYTESASIQPIRYSAILRLNQSEQNVVDLWQ